MLHFGLVEESEVYGFFFVFFFLQPGKEVTGGGGCPSSSLEYSSNQVLEIN